MDDLLFTGEEQEVNSIFTQIQNQEALTTSCRKHSWKHASPGQDEELLNVEQHKRYRGRKGLDVDYARKELARGPFAARLQASNCPTPNSVKTK